MTARAPFGFGRLVRAAVARDGERTGELRRGPGGFGLGQVPVRLQPQATTTAVCGFCSLGCGLEIHLRDGAAVNVSPAADYPVNRGMACPKGWEALTPLGARNRATTPLMRRGKKLVPTSWTEALGELVGRFGAIGREHGPEAVAFLGTGQLPTEELALFGALAKFGMGMIHGDGNTRQCMATAVVAYKESFGFDAPPYTYADMEESDLVFLVGSNPCITHPILWERVLRNRRRPRVVVFDPRRTETAMAATDHVALAPKSDLLLFYAIAHVLVKRGWIDASFIQAHTNAFEDFARHVEGFDPQLAERASGVPAARIEELARWIHEAERASFWWTMGVNQSHEGVRVAQSLVNLALMTGNIGRPGTGANSITGQCNAMGSRLFANTTSLLGGHDFANAEHRAKVARVLAIPEERITHQASWSYDRILEGVLAGKIRGLWIVATNTAHSWINQADVEDILGRLDFLVVQDMYHDTETAQHAHLVLPAAGWGEKEGTFINSERRVGLLKKVARAPGQALSDFEIFRLVAQAWGVGDLFARWSSPEAVFRILQELTRDRPCDISGMGGYDALERSRGVQWPVPAGAHVEPSAERRLFEDGRFFHPDGRARFVFDAPRSVPEPTDDRFPLTLLTGRGTSSQWHTQTRTRCSDVLRALSPADPYVEVGPADAARLGVKSMQWIVVESRRGKLRARAFVTPTVQPGQCFVPMHDSRTNRLTFSAFDPHSRQPAYKACAARIRLAGPTD